jgi:hypothetical protein
MRNKTVYEANPSALIWMGILCQRREGINVTNERMRRKAAMDSNVKHSGMHRKPAMDSNVNYSGSGALL